jgi:hypothetical protein
VTVTVTVIDSATISLINERYVSLKEDKPVSDANRSWRTSSRCAADRPQCVEVSLEPTVAVRDTKNPDGTRILNVDTRSWAQFVNAIAR